MLLRTVLLIGSFSTLLCFIAASEEIQVKLVIGGDDEDKTKCPRGFPDEKHSDLVVDYLYSIAYSNKTLKILERPDFVNYADGKANLTDLVHQLPIQVDRNKDTEIAVILYVRGRLGLRGDNEIYYGYNPKNMHWDQSPAVSEPTADGSEWKVQPFRIASYFDGKETYSFECDDPTAWIANHGIYKITKTGAENLYYDPSRKSHKFLT